VKDETVLGGVALGLQGAGEENRQTQTDQQHVCACVCVRVCE
jgi:hypothetical protein